MKCLNCQQEFESQRSTAKFCSDKCKLAYHRKEADDTLRDKIDTLRKDSVTPKSVNILTLKDFGIDPKDLGIQWAPEGGPIFLRNDITAEQVRDLVRVMCAMKGKEFKPHVSPRQQEVI